MSLTPEQASEVADLERKIYLVKNNPEYLRLLTISRNIRDDQRFKAYVLHLDSLTAKLKKITDKNPTNKPIGKLREQAARPVSRDEIVEHIDKNTPKSITKPLLQPKTVMTKSTAGRTMKSNTMLAKLMQKPEQPIIKIHSGYMVGERFVPDSDVQTPIQTPIQKPEQKFEQKFEQKQKQVEKPRSNIPIEEDELVDQLGDQIHELDNIILNQDTLDDLLNTDF